MLTFRSKGEYEMSTKKAIGDSFAAIFILIVSQLIAQGIASAFGLIRFRMGFAI